MPLLTLIRHGETDWNRQHRIQGHSDIPLNAAGLGQASALARRLAGQPCDAIYASDLRRAFQTAEVIGGLLEQPVIPEPRLREVGFGIFEGLTTQEIEARYPAEYEAWSRVDQVMPPEAESVESLTTRVSDFLTELQARHAADDHLVLVAHGGPVALIACLLLGVPPAQRWRFQVKNAALCQMGMYDLGGMLIVWNDQSHLV